MMFFLRIFVAAFIWSTCAAHAQVGAAVTPPRVLQLVAFTTSGTFNWTVPSGVNTVYPFGCGAGGGGGAGVGLANNAGGGGGGAAKCLQPFGFTLSVTPGQTLQIFVAAKGTGGVVGGAAATDGGNTDILGGVTPAGYNIFFPRLYGGLHGIAGVANTGGTGGNGGGLITGGTGGSAFNPGFQSLLYGGTSGGGGGAGGGTVIGLQGITGGSSLIFETLQNSSQTVSGGGPGGNSIFGLGGTGNATAVAGSVPAAGSCGAGGAGGGSNAAGAAGADGCIFILY